MKRLAFICWMFVAGFTVNANNEASVTINIKRQTGSVSEGLYGFLLEHLYHSVSNGLWGECVWNRSFEEMQAMGQWSSTSDGVLTLHACGQGRQLFRIGKARDGVLRLDVRRLVGGGDIVIGVRDQHREGMLTNRVFLHLGADSSYVETATGWIWHTPVTTLNAYRLSSPVQISNGWNHMELLFQGDRLKVSLGGECIFDREIKNCPKDGAITIGGEDCEIAFRRISADDTEGNPVALNLNLSRHWNLVGKGLSAVEDHVPLNQDVAIRIESKGGWAGLEQVGKYYLRRDDPLCGSIYLKGESKRVRVQLLSKGRVVAEQVLNPLTDQWKEFPLILVPKEDCRDASLRIIGQDLFWVDQVSLLHQSSIKNGGYRKELAEAVANLKPTMLRWPGGSFSEHYRFELGIGPQHERRGILRWDDFDPLSFGTDEFIAFCQKVAAEPVIVVPIGYHNYAGYSPDSILTAHDKAALSRETAGRITTDWLQRALNWIEYCNGDTTTHWGRLRARNGHPEPYGVHYWEIDNEVWKMEPKLYVEIARAFSQAMKRKDPSIKIIGCGCGRLGAEGVGLDSVLIHDAAQHFDYISPHYYQTIDKFHADGVEEYGRYLDKLARWIAHSKNPQMKIYLSEWNLDGIDMRTGLFAGGFLNRLERTPAVEMAAPALLLRHISAPGWNNAFINFDQDHWFGAPNYVVMSLWRRHYLPRLVDIEGDMGRLNMVATASEDGRQTCLKVVNTEGRDVRLRIRNGRQLGQATWELVGSGDLMVANSLSEPHRVGVRTMAVSYDGQDLCIDVPAYSASVVSWVSVSR